MPDGGMQTLAVAVIGDGFDLVVAPLRTALGALPLPKLPPINAFPHEVVDSIIDSVTEFYLERELGAQPETELLKPVEEFLSLVPTHVVRVLMSKLHG